MAKIKGLKRRQKELDDWIECYNTVDIDSLKEYGYTYAKAKFGPWSNLFCDRPYPKGYKRQLFTSLINFYFDWQKEIEKHFDKYYLSIWISTPNFLNSQIVAAIGDSISHYENLFEKSEKSFNFPLKEFPHEAERIKLFDWNLHNDYQYYHESEFLGDTVEDFLNPKDFYSWQRFYKKLLKDNVPIKLVDTEDGKKEKVFCKPNGHIFVGNIRN